MHISYVTRLEYQSGRGEAPKSKHDADHEVKKVEVVLGGDEAVCVCVQVM